MWCHPYESDGERKSCLTGRRFDNFSWARWKLLAVWMAKPYRLNKKSVYVMGRLDQVKGLDNYLLWSFPVCILLNTPPPPPLPSLSLSPSKLSSFSRFLKQSRWSSGRDYPPWLWSLLWLAFVFLHSLRKLELSETLLQIHLKVLFSLSNIFSF